MGVFKIIFLTSFPCDTTQMTQAYLGAVLSGSEEGVLELLRDSKVNVDVTLRVSIICGD